MRVAWGGSGSVWVGVRWCKVVRGRVGLGWGGVWWGWGVGGVDRGGVLAGVG